MKRYMLDTNTVSHLIKEHPAVADRVLAVPMAALCISAITEGELRFGLAKRPDAQRLQLAVQEFLRRVDVLPWDATVTRHYGSVRADISSFPRSAWECRGRRSSVFFDTYNSTKPLQRWSVAG